MIIINNENNNIRNIISNNKNLGTVLYYWFLIAFIIMSII